MKRRIISGILALIMIMTCIPMNVFADEGGDYNGSGGGQSGGSTGGGLSWSTSRQGYRITIVDNDGNIVADPVDFLYSNVPNGTEAYFDCKLENLGTRRTENKRYIISDVMKSEGFNESEPWPSAMIWTYVQSLGKEGPIGQGEGLKKWMLNGGFISSYPSGSGGHAPSGGTNDSDKPSKPNPDKADDPITPDKPNPEKPGNEDTPDPVNPVETDKPEEPSYKDMQQHIDRYLEMYERLMREEVKYYKIYDYNENEITEGLYNYVIYILNPEIDELDLLDKEKQMLKKGVLELYFKIMKDEESRKNSKSSALMQSRVYLDYDPIPLAPPDSEDGDVVTVEDGYIKPLLDYKVNGEYVFKIQGEDNSLAGEGRASIIAQNNYRVLIEPILWFTPLTKSKQSYGKYLYGTITNHAQWSEYMRNNGGFDDSNIWHYSNITRKVGCWSLYTEEDEVFTKLTIKSPADDFNRTIKTPELADNTVGYALHVYRALPGEVIQQTYDEECGKNEHPAPDPGKIPLAEGESPESRKINIVKTYKIDEKHVVTYYRTKNPKKIKIMDEPEYKVKEWFISEVFNNPNTTTTWEENKLQAPISTQDDIVVSGVAPTTVDVKKPSTTLYVLLVKTEEPEKTRPTGDLIIRESQITKAVETINDNIPNWGAKIMSFKAPSLQGTCSFSQWKFNGFMRWQEYCNQPYILDDFSWSYNHKNIEPIDEEIQANVGAFKPENERGADAEGNRFGVAEETHNIKSFNYKLTIWRGKDIPTLASYKESGGHELLALTGLYGKQPQGKRYNGSYYRNPIKITLDMDISLGDYITKSKHHPGFGLVANHVNLNKLNYDAEALVEVYWGKKHEVGDKHVNGTLRLRTWSMVVSEKPKHYGGKMIKYQDKVTWYPYIRMTYQTTGRADDDRTNVNVLSQWLSEIVPNDYVEAAWMSDSEYNMNLTSTQWSLHSRATSGDLGWNYPNTVLPGGAIYTLDTSGKKTSVNIVTWQPYLEDDIRDKVIISGSDYDYEKTKEPHEKLVKEAKEALEDWRVVQYVKDFKHREGKTPDLYANTDSTIALDGVKIEGGNQSLNALGLNHKTNTDEKYYMKKASVDDKVNEGDIDIIAEKTVEVKYKVTADVEGKIHVFRNIENGGWTEIATLNKWEGAESLKGEALELDNRTKIITNLCTVLTRNAGNDNTASWAKEDGKWYNEAFDGICYTRRETCFRIGFKKTPVRSAALDPALCPTISSKGNIFSKAFISQFFMNDKSDRFPDEQNGFIGHFKDEDVILPGYKEMFKTKPFAIPNANVQDLH